MKPKKIAIVANSTWNIFNFRLSLIKHFSSLGYTVVVIAPIDEYIQYLNESYFTKHIPLKHLKPQKKNLVSDYLLFKELKKIFREERPDYVLTYTIKPNIYGTLAAKSLGITAIPTVTGLGYTFMHQKWSTEVVKGLYVKAFAGLNAVIFHNQDDKALFVENAIISDAQGMVIPGSGVNTNYFRPMPAKKEEAKFTFLFVGRLLKDKGIIEYVQAAQKARQIATNTQFWVVGQINENSPNSITKNQLLKWLDQRIIKYFGQTKDVRQFYKNADVIVLPSYREGLPKSILEAMAMGKAVITTNAPGCKDTVPNNDNGYLVEAGDALSLSKAMVDIYNLDQEALEEMGHSSRNLALEKFDDKIINATYVQLVTPDKEVSAEVASLPE